MVMFSSFVCPHRIIADDWLEFTFPDNEDAQLLVSAVLQLRSVWARLLEMKLKGKDSHAVQNLQMHLCIAIV